MTISKQCKVGNRKTSKHLKVVAKMLFIRVWFSFTSYVLLIGVSLFF